MLVTYEDPQTLADAICHDDGRETRGMTIMKAISKLSAAEGAGEKRLSEVWKLDVAELLKRV